MSNHLHTNLFVHACLFILDILLELLQRLCVGGRAVGLEYCDITGGETLTSHHWAGFGSDHCEMKDLQVTYSSVRGVIFFSGSSSSAKFFWYFSQFCPVALGMM